MRKAQQILVMIYDEMYMLPACRNKYYENTIEITTNANERLD